LMLKHGNFWASGYVSSDERLFILFSGVSCWD